MGVHGERLPSMPPKSRKSRGDGRISMSRSGGCSAFLSWSISMKSRVYLQRRRAGVRVDFLKPE